MKIVFANMLMGMYRGGGENFDLHLSSEFAKLGHDIEYYYMRPIFSAAKEDMSDFPVHYPVRSPWLYNVSQTFHNLPILKHLRGIRGLPRYICQVVFELNVCHKLWRRRKEKFAVHCCGLLYVALFVQKVLKKQVFLRYPGPPKLPFHGQLTRYSKHVIANGDAYKQMIKIEGLNPVKVNVGVDKSIYYPMNKTMALREELDLPKDKKLLLFVGRFIAVKNIPLLLDVMSRLKDHKDIVLVLVGEGQQQKLLQSLVEAKQLQSQVIFRDFQNKANLARYYNAADIFVLTSNYDNFPNVVIEAMACGLPVIASDVGGVSQQVLQGKTGYVFPLSDPQAMADYIVQLTADEALYQTMAFNAAAEIAQEYCWSKTAASYLDLLETV